MGLQQQEQKGTRPILPSKQKTPQIHIQMDKKHGKVEAIMPEVNQQETYQRCKKQKKIKKVELHHTLFIKL